MTFDFIKGLFYKGASMGEGLHCGSSGSELFPYLGLRGAGRRSYFHLGTKVAVWRGPVTSGGGPWGLATSTSCSLPVSCWGPQGLEHCVGVGSLWGGTWRGEGSCSAPCPLPGVCPPPWPPSVPPHAGHHLPLTVSPSVSFTDSPSLCFPLDLSSPLLCPEGSQWGWGPCTFPK